MSSTPPHSEHNDYSGVPQPAQPLDKEAMHHIHMLVKDLTIPEKRENALVDLSKKRESVPDLAPILLNSFGTIAALLQEIVSIYPLLSPPKLKALPSNRVCNALALLQCVASHPDTRTFFLHSHIPLFLYPFLNTSSKNRPFEYLRLTSLGVIGALVKIDDSTVIDFLLSTEIMTLCVRIMETGSELSKTVATFIVQKILLDDMGLNYICATNERIIAFLMVLKNMVVSLIEQPSPRLLKHVIRCYLRLAENPKSRELLRQYIPMALQDGTFNSHLKDDKDFTIKRWLTQLLFILNPQQEQFNPNMNPSINTPPLSTPLSNISAAINQSLTRNMNANKH
ncbi:cell differentiation family [Heterostelium album PN500]|uniref:Cell differentiation family n=1 Tax=Heterostelium pallidum (strain ATCC 26659 / Pp 5 / PN500) TaxID=670386 RepID=D3B485_HETP5|nr:cell differentiation family [Heterostelium album PN500]EFA84133.1 cell differentiation family [Heterostelium album PN500]|eukprot:XP_020436250.1 cell differentiation family [Heterostelium album PN500]